MDKTNQAGKKKKNWYFEWKSRNITGRWGRRLLLQVLGICSVFCTTNGINPVVAAFFAAMFLEQQDRWFLMGSMSVAMLIVMPFLTTVKYITIMFIISILYKYYSR